MKQPIAICWFRRDLRLEDNAALYHALRSPYPVLPLFIFDPLILDKLENKADKRVDFIHQALEAMQTKLVGFQSSLLVLHRTPPDAFREITDRFHIQAVYCNHDYEPYAQERDLQVATFLQSKGIPFHSYKDQVLLEKDEVLKDDGKPYTVFTPYSRKWKQRLTAFHLKSYPTEKYHDAYWQTEPFRIPTLEEIGFHSTGFRFHVPVIHQPVLQQYAQNRDIPSVPGTSRLSVHLRFGTISIRALARSAQALSEAFLNELIWRDFYHMILWHFPQVGKGKAFKPAYDHIAWKQDEVGFAAWCKGETGYPIVDAGMRELNETGFMHNRVRMITASFLCKHLLIDWRWGEAYFAEKLLDFDLAANNGGWQWAAGSGCDAAPYFRIFNPTLQTKKFDPQLKYIRKWVPEIDQLHYTRPIVEHELARKRCLEVYGQALK
jgi:deoxyribodipyrimidine photo-lyase